MFGTRKLGKKLKNKSVRTMMHLKWVFWDILGQLGTFWDNSEDFLTSLDHLDCFPSHFRPFYRKAMAKLRKINSLRCC